MPPPPPPSTPFPYTTLFRSAIVGGILVGWIWPEFASNLKPLADGFIKLIKMLIAPIIFCTVVLDRKSTRLNSSHVEISYAVFCLKKKKSENGDWAVFAYFRG